MARRYTYSIQRVSHEYYEYRIVLGGAESFVDYFFDRKDAVKWIECFKYAIWQELGRDVVFEELEDGV